MQRVNLEEVGGTMVIALPPEIVDELHLTAGSSVSLALQGDALVMRRGRRSKYTLQELIDKSDPRAFERTKEDDEWFNSPPVGRELL
jgi:antitoxin ChpS